MLILQQVSLGISDWACHARCYSGFYSRAVALLYMSSLLTQCSFTTLQISYVRDADDSHIYLSDDHGNLYGCSDKLSCATQAIFFNRRFNFNLVSPAVWLNGLSIDSVHKVKSLVVKFNFYFDRSVQNIIRSIVRKVYDKLSTLKFV